MEVYEICTKCKKGLDEKQRAERVLMRNVDIVDNLVHKWFFAKIGEIAVWIKNGEKWIEIVDNVDK